jgi:4-hydroxy-4-methyl-2-oxoglutarate aldolase
MERGEVNGPVTVGGVRVEPGDLILGDDDGLVVIPRGEAAGAIGAALAMVAAEAGWVARLAAGETTLEVFKVPAAATR